MGDFNVTMDDKFMIDFCQLNDLSNLIGKPTCYKNFDKPTCIDLILTNKLNCCQQGNVFETVLSDFHMLTVTEFKMGFQKLKPQAITYSNYKNFNNDRFQADIKTCGFETKDITSFRETILSVFNKYAPIKKKYVRANEPPFMTKTCVKLEKSEIQFLIYKFQKFKKMRLILGVIMTLCYQLLTHFKITQALLILNKENLT